MTVVRTDCVVVGAGPAGLAVSVALGARGIDHLVLERDRVGQTWRTQRWDSLRLNNAGWMNPMLGPQPADTYLTASEVVERLCRLAARCPMREQSPVSSLSPDRDGWRLWSGDTHVRARAVVVATGGENVPRRPAMAARVPDRVRQYHAAGYRSPGQLPEGAVLVVGSAQSGYQITEELLAAGRRVILATSEVGRAPARHRGRDTIEWLVECGFFDQRPQDLPDPSVINRPQPLLAPNGRSASLQRLARSGAALAGRLTAVDGDVVTFDDSVAANMAAADAYAARIRTLLDEAIGQSGRRGETAGSKEADALDLPVPVPPMRTLDLRTADVGSIVWCTGYTGDFSWLPPKMLDDAGRPIHRDTAAPGPGLWYVGLRWLTRRSSGNFLGFPADAATVAENVASYVGHPGGRRPVGSTLDD